MANGKWNKKSCSMHPGPFRSFDTANKTGTKNDLLLSRWIFGGNLVGLCNDRFDRYSVVIVNYHLLHDFSGYCAGS